MTQGTCQAAGTAFYVDDRTVAAVFVEEEQEPGRHQGAVVSYAAKMDAGEDAAGIAAVVAVAEFAKYQIFAYSSLLQ